MLPIYLYTGELPNNIHVRTTPTFICIQENLRTMYTFGPHLHLSVYRRTSEQCTRLDHTYIYLYTGELLNNVHVWTTPTFICIQENFRTMYTFGPHLHLSVYRRTSEQCTRSDHTYIYLYTGELPNNVHVRTTPTFNCIQENFRTMYTFGPHLYLSVYRRTSEQCTRSDHTYIYLYTVEPQNNVHVRTTPTFICIQENFRTMYTFGPHLHLSVYRRTSEQCTRSDHTYIYLYTEELPNNVHVRTTPTFICIQENFRTMYTFGPHLHLSVYRRTSETMYKFGTHLHLSVYRRTSEQCTRSDHTYIYLYTVEPQNNVHVRTTPTFICIQENFRTMYTFGPHLHLSVYRRTSEQCTRSDHTYIYLYTEELPNNVHVRTTPTFICIQENFRTMYTFGPHLHLSVYRRTSETMYKFGTHLHLSVYRRTSEQCTRSDHTYIYLYTGEPPNNVHVRTTPTFICIQENFRTMYTFGPHLHLSVYRRTSEQCTRSDHTYIYLYTGELLNNVHVRTTPTFICIQENFRTMYTFGPHLHLSVYRRTSEQCTRSDHTYIYLYTGELPNNVHVRTTPTFICIQENFRNNVQVRNTPTFICIQENFRTMYTFGPHLHLSVYSRTSEQCTRSDHTYIYLYTGELPNNVHVRTTPTFICIQENFRTMYTFGPHLHLSVYRRTSEQCTRSDHTYIYLYTGELPNNVHVRTTPTFICIQENFRNNVQVRNTPTFICIQENFRTMYTFGPHLHLSVYRRTSEQCTRSDHTYIYLYTGELPNNVHVRTTPTFICIQENFRTMYTFGPHLHLSVYRRTSEQCTRSDHTYIYLYTGELPNNVHVRTTSTFICIQENFRTDYI